MTCTGKISIHQLNLPLATPEQELHILRGKLLHSDLVIIDSAIDHISFLLLEHDHTALDRVLDAKPGDHARALLADTVAAICGLPFCGWVPPSR